MYYLQQVIDRTLETETDLKKDSKTFYEFLKKARENTWLVAAYKGDPQPEWCFPDKEKDETYKEYKTRHMAHA